MYISNIKAIVWVLPNPGLLKEGNVHDHSGCISTQYLGSYTEQISLRSYDGQRKRWTVDKCITESCIDQDLAAKERGKVVRHALKGYNTACLFLHIGGDIYAFEKRMLEKKLLLQELENRIKPDTIIEYAYFCVNDIDCYDMRKEVLRSKKSVLEKGIDTWLKKTDKVIDIWEDISSGAKDPHIIKIRLTDHLTKRSSHLCIFDLCHPRILESTPETRHTNIYYSFKKIRDLVDLVVESDRTNDYYTNVNDNVWTSLLAPFISGSGKLVIFTYLNECPKEHLVETSMALDFIEKMRCIKSNYLPNELIKGPIAVNEGALNECQQNLREAKLCIDNLLKEKASTESYIASLKDKIGNDTLREENAELQKKLNHSTMKLKEAGNFFKKIVASVVNRMNQTKNSSSQWINQLTQEKKKLSDLCKRLKHENSQLLLKNRYLKDELSTEFAFALKEKNELKAYIKVLQETVDRMNV